MFYKSQMVKHVADRTDLIALAVYRVPPYYRQSADSALQIGHDTDDT